MNERVKYRVIVNGDDIDVVTDDFGIATIRPADAEDYETLIDYYQDRWTPDMIKNDTLWEEVGNGKMYCDEFQEDYRDPIHIQRALEWLCVGCEFEEDPNLFSSLFGQGRRYHASCGGCKHNTYHSPVDHMEPVSWCMLKDMPEEYGCDDYDEGYTLFDQL